MIRSGNFFGPVSRTVQRQFHVRLPAAKPDVTNENLVQFDMLRPVNFHRVGSPGRGRVDFHLPPAVLSGSGDRGMSRDLYVDGITRRGPTPNGVRLSALEHHA